MRKAAIILVALAAALSVACSTMTTAVDYDHTINWSKFHTFQIMEGTKDPVTFTQKRIEDGITAALTAKGWQPTTTNPDILVYSHVVLSSRSSGTRPAWAASAIAAGAAWAAWPRPPRPTSRSGRSIVDLVDPSTHEMSGAEPPRTRSPATARTRGRSTRRCRSSSRTSPGASG